MDFPIFINLDRTFQVLRDVRGFLHFTRQPIQLLHRIKSILFYEEDGPVSIE